MCQILGVGVVPSATTGIAAIILPGGLTAHSTYGIPANVDPLDPPSVKFHTERGRRLRESFVHITDEVGMMSKVVLNAIHYTLNSMLLAALRNKAFFGNKLIIISGDLKQIMPIVKGGKPQDSAEDSILFSPFFRLFKILHLTENMRVGPGEAEFCEWLRKIGEGTIWAEGSEDEVQLKHEMCVKSLDELIDFVYKREHLSEPLKCNLV